MKKKNQEYLTQAAAVKAFEMAAEFLTNARLVISSPRLMKKSNDGFLLTEKKMYVAPDIHVVNGSRRIRVIHPHYLISGRAYRWSNVDNTSLPDFVYAFIHQDYYSYGKSDTGYPIDYSQERKVFVENELVQKFTEQIKAEWERVEQNASKIWDEVSEKRAPHYQKEFRRKFVKFLNV